MVAAIIGPKRQVIIFLSKFDNRRRNLASFFAIEIHIIAGHVAEAQKRKKNIIAGAFCDEFQYHRKTPNFACDYQTLTKKLPVVSTLENVFC